MGATLREKHALDTRRALLRAARALFARHGYEATSVDQIAEKAGATRGALYHHFDAKRDVLLAVLDDMQGELAQRVNEAARQEQEPWLRVRVALATFLDACEEPATARILLQEAPAVLGWDVWREVDRRHYLGMTMASVRDLIRAGLLPELEPELTAHLLIALLTESVLWLQHNRSPEARRHVDQALETFVRGLLINRQDQAHDSAPS
jgi:AcrR family transcriptional regulator